MKVYLEVGARRTFACAIDWPGWCRAGKAENDALDALIDYGPRYAAALGSAASSLAIPRSVDELHVTERLKGNATTDFGAPGIIPEADRQPVSDEELKQLVAVIWAAWRTFDAAAEAAQERTLAASGPRGGGRNLARIREHVRDAERSYTSAVGGKGPRSDAEWPAVQRAFIDAVRARALGELPERGPRGRERWPPRYAIRRSAWHALDHAWEIDDRVVTA